MMIHVLLTGASVPSLAGRGGAVREVDLGERRLQRPGRRVGLGERRLQRPADRKVGHGERRLQRPTDTIKDGSAAKGEPRGPRRPQAGKYDLNRSGRAGGSDYVMLVSLYEACECPAANTGPSMGERGLIRGDGTYGGDSSSAPEEPGLRRLGA